ncbi:nucleotidyltransferase domain-containing protein [Tissierella sp.]|uniref:nucleotidyltransferase family protein n=1 Tax=Tissierella sp. TaxID=41274 RepID=UPI00285CFAAA|nr:nucleotidyltransferase domain-containing protein [Tissierella sp.]MDR7856604.1 nucleotidyltransferase domain-containing protein [Tissierella sp.]
MGNRVLEIEDIKKVVNKLAIEYGVERVYLFGSYARGDASPKSDIDLRIDRGEIKGLFQLSGFYLELEDALNKKVDVVTTDSLDSSFLELISKEEIVVYGH